MEALLDMCSLGDNPQLTRHHLPGVSAGLETKALGLLLDLSTTLLHNAAALAYGGHFLPQGTLQKLVDAAASLPNNLVEGVGRTFQKTYPKLPVFRQFSQARGRAAN